jgi:PqqD family protein of HPr-rel-A system
MTDDTTIFVRKGEPLTAKADDQTVMFDAAKGEYFGLAGVGGRIWELLEQPRSIGQLCEVITAEFEVSAADCRADVSSFLDDLRRAGLVEARA